MLQDAAADAAITKWQNALAGKVAEIQYKYADSHPLAAELLTDVDHWWQVATEFANGAPTLSNISDADIQRAQYNAVDLLEMRAYLKGLYFGSVVPDNVKFNAVGLMTAPIKWLQSIGTPVLQTQAKYEDMVKTAADLPSLSLKYLLDQLLKSLSLPSWTVPVIAGGAILGAGAWIYLTFLAPVGRVTRTVRYANPRRRRRA